MVRQLIATDGTDVTGEGLHSRVEPRHEKMLYYHYYITGLQLAMSQYYKFANVLRRF